MRIRGTNDEMTDIRHELAMDLFQKAYKLQTQGDLDLAVELYRQSIKTFPTAEAYTFLGWTYRFQGKLNQAIAECKNAIAIDPSFGNPYNDIGAYLMELDKAEEAIPWLEKATRSARYEAYHYPWYNLGRAYLSLELYTKARECFERSLQIEPTYPLAKEGLRRVRYLVQ